MINPYVCIPYSADNSRIVNYHWKMLTNFSNLSKPQGLRSDDYEKSLQNKDHQIVFTNLDQYYQ